MVGPERWRIQAQSNIVGEERDAPAIIIAFVLRLHGGHKNPG